MIKELIVQNEKELKDCFKVRNTVFTKEQGIPDEIDIDEYDVLDYTKSCLIIIYDEDKPIATGRLKYIDSRTVQFNRICVIKEYRGNGIGEALLKALESFAIIKGYSKVYIEAQVSAKNFYINCGYIDMKEEQFLEAGIPHIKLTKALA